MPPAAANKPATRSEDLWATLLPAGWAEELAVLTDAEVCPAHTHAASPSALRFSPAAGRNRGRLLGRRKRAGAGRPWEGRSRIALRMMPQLPG